MPIQIENITMSTTEEVETDKAHAEDLPCTASEFGATTRPNAIVNMKFLNMDISPDRDFTWNQ